jgi:membrane-bound ClpP family serine protease
MLSIKVRIYLFYVAAVAFVSIGLWLIGAGLFSTGGFTALVVGGLMLATGVVDYAMGRYLQRMYLQPAQQSGQSRPVTEGHGAGSPGGGSAA